MQQPVAVGGAAELGAHDLGQRVLIRLGQGARAQPHLVGFEFGLGRVFQAYNLLQQSPDALGRWLGRGRIPTRSISSAEGVRQDASCVTVLHMLSMSNATADTRDRILQAAASCVVDFGVDRVTLAEIARRAGVSRPTVYRRWPDTRSIMSALLTNHITDVMREVPVDGDDREALVKQVVAVADRLRRDELIMSVMHSELARVYITERLGASQQFLIAGLAARLRVAQRTGSVRAGDPVDSRPWCC